MNHYGGQLQINLEGDFDQFIKHIRQQQDYFVKTIQCINQIINDQVENQIYIHQNINRYRHIIREIKQFQPVFKQIYSMLLSKYQDSKYYKNSEIFLKRVLYRILQLLFNNISLINHKFPIIYQQYVRLKTHCLAILQQNVSNKPYQLIQTITQYSLSKTQKYSQLLQYLANHLQNGNIDFVSNVQINLFLQKPTTKQQIDHKKQQRRYSVFDFTKISKSKIQQSELPKVQIPKDKVKIVITRKIKKIYENVKEVLQVSKNSFMLDLVNQTQNNKQDLYKQLLLRNKINQKQICQFQSKKRKYQKMTKLQNQLKQVEQKHIADKKRKSFQKVRKIRNNIKFKLVEKSMQKNIPLIQNNSLQSTIEINNEQQSLLKDADEEVTKDSEQKAAQIQNYKDKVLPILLKRKALSVDKHYKQSDQIPQFQLKVLSSSIKINKLQPIKSIKINLTPTQSVNTSSNIEQSLIRYTNKLCF